MHIFSPIPGNTLEEPVYEDFLPLLNAHVGIAHYKKLRQYGDSLVTLSDDRVLIIRDPTPTRGKYEYRMVAIDDAIKNDLDMEIAKLTALRRELDNDR